MFLGALDLVFSVSFTVKLSKFITQNNQDIERPEHAWQ